jgi:hypothetical protein
MGWGIFNRSVTVVRSCSTIQSVCRFCLLLWHVITYEEMPSLLMLLSVADDEERLADVLW